MNIRTKQGFFFVFFDLSGSLRQPAASIYTEGYAEGNYSPGRAVPERKSRIEI